MPSSKTVHIQFNKENKYQGKVDPGHDIQDGHFNVEVTHDEHKDVEKNHEQAEYIHKFLGGKSKIDNEKRLEGLAKVESTLAEISKDKLKSYIKANVEDRLLRQTGASFKSGKSGDEYNKADETNVDKKREKGMDTALNKLAKESEDLDEGRFDLVSLANDHLKVANSAKEKMYSAGDREERDEHKHDYTFNMQQHHALMYKHHSESGDNSSAELHKKEHTKFTRQFMNESFGAKILSAIINNKPIQAQEEFAIGLSSIIKDRIDTRKQEIAKSVFGSSSQE